MTKKSTQPDAEEELYAQAAGAIGVLCIAAGILAAIKDKLGLSWGGAVAVAVGALVALGYAAWWTRTRIHAYLHRKRQPAASRQEGPQGT